MQKKHMFVASAALVIGLSAVIANAPAASGNDRCPVRPHLPAVSSISTIHNGKVIYFCCEECVAKFQAEPEKYLARLTSAAAEQVKAGSQPINWVDVWTKLEKWLDHYQALFVYYLLLLIMTLIAIRSRRKALRKHPGKANVSSFMSPLANMAVVLVFAQAGLIVELLWGDKVRNRAIRQGPALAAAAAASNDPNRAPQEAKLYMDMWADLVAQERPRLKRSYYRGNDERNEKLFNGGAYRTVDFVLSLRTDDGRDVEHGADVAGRKLFLQFEIVRSPNTLDSLFTDEGMARYNLMLRPESGSYSPDEAKQKKVGLTTLKPKQHWVARCPIGELTGMEKQRFSGLYFLGESVYDSGKFEASRVHYWVWYDIPVEQGRIGPTAQISMGAALNPVPNQRREWFSQEPIPVNPNPQPAAAAGQPEDGPPKINNESKPKADEKKPSTPAKTDTKK